MNEWVEPITSVVRLERCYLRVETMAKHKILIVDDSVSFRMEIKGVLESEYDVIEACDGTDAIAVYSENLDTAFIICDYNMPNMDGLTAMEAIFKQSPNGKVPSLILTTECSDDLKKKGRAIGVSGWVIKPYDERILLAGIKSILSNSK